VAEGNWHNKLKKIHDNSYLHNAYLHLKKSTGSIFTFGVSFNNDEHILHAVKDSKISQLFIGKYDKSNKKIETQVINGLRNINDNAIKIHTYDTTKTAIW
jgi:hypothetical protein